jgi:hypothetical protein
MADEARVIGGKLWTLRRVVDPWGRRPLVPWAGYCDGDRVGFYRTKGEFWRVAEALARRGSDEQCEQSAQVEMTSAVEGCRILDNLRKWNGKRV